MPHHMEDLERQIPYSLEKTWSQIPGVCPGGGGDVEVSNWSVHQVATHVVAENNCRNIVIQDWVYECIIKRLIAYLIVIIIIISNY
jgi:hypothetical protein